MAQAAAPLDPEILTCCLCLELLNNPVTIPCGHSYCRKCLQQHWEEQKKQRKVHDCPQCRRAFTQRPTLEKNTVIAALVETLEKSELKAAPAGLCCTEAGNVACDVNAVAAAAAERTARHKELDETRQNIQQKIQNKEKDLKVLQKEVESINDSADKAVKDSEEIVSQIISKLKKKCSEVQQQVRSTQGAAVSQVKELQKKLEQEIMELKRRDAELGTISQKLDHRQFFCRLSSLPTLSLSPDFSRLEIHPKIDFEDVAAALRKLRDEIQQVLIKSDTNVSIIGSNIDVLLPQPEQEPRTREDFLRYFHEVTLDPNTVNKCLFLSEKDRKVTNMGEDQCYCDHPDRFTEWWQVLSREGLTGRCYWEFKWEGWWSGGVGVAVAYKTIVRAGTTEESEFGSNDKSWRLYCSSEGYDFHHDNVTTYISGPESSRVGVYLDHRAGLLSFYSITGTMELLHRVRTTFTQPLYVGFGVNPGSSAQLIDLSSPL